jgi:hypothetical protein
MIQLLLQLRLLEPLEYVVGERWRLPQTITEQCRNPVVDDDEYFVYTFTSSIVRTVLVYATERQSSNYTCGLNYSPPPPPLYHTVLTKHLHW